MRVCEVVNAPLEIGVHMLPFKRLFDWVTVVWLVFNVCLSLCECAAITPSRLAMVALAACGGRQTQPDCEQPFTVGSLQSGPLTKLFYGADSMQELSLL